jgi:hypothetical protein
MPVKPESTATTSAAIERFGSDLMMAFQVAWNSAPSSTAARTNALKEGPHEDSARAV